MAYKGGSFNTYADSNLSNGCRTIKKEMDLFSESLSWNEENKYTVKEIE